MEDEEEEEEEEEDEHEANYILFEGLRNATSLKLVAAQTEVSTMLLSCFSCILPK